MADKNGASGSKKPVADRNDRLKNALKANLARRKAQARARADADRGHRAGNNGQAGAKTEAQSKD
ncbi:MAG: hypothetical protein ACWA5A_16545 [Marinibacterium sp.]